MHYHINMYTHKLTVDQTFVSGALEGVTLRDYHVCDFCSEADAIAWVASVSKKPAKVGYKILSHRIVAL